MGRPQLQGQAIWPPIPSSWGIREGIPCVAPPRFRGLLDILISQVKFAFDNPPQHTHSSAPPITGSRALTLNSLLSHYCPLSFGIFLSVSQTKASGLASHPIRRQPAGQQLVKEGILLVARAQWTENCWEDQAECGHHASRR